MCFGEGSIFHSGDTRGVLNGVKHLSCIHHAVRDFLHLLSHFHTSVIQGQRVVLDREIFIYPLQITAQSLQSILCFSELFIQCSDGAAYFSNFMAHLVLGLIPAQFNIGSVGSVLQTCLCNLENISMTDLLLISPFQICYQGDRNRFPSYGMPNILDGGVGDSPAKAVIVPVFNP